MSTIASAPVLTTFEKLENWVAGQFANHEEAKRKMSAALVADHRITEWLFESLVEAQAYVVVAYNVRQFLEVDKGDLAPLERHVERTVFGFTAPRATGLSGFTEAYTAEAWAKVARIMKGI